MGARGTGPGLILAFFASAGLGSVAIAQTPGDPSPGSSAATPAGSSVTPLAPRSSAGPEPVVPPEGSPPPVGDVLTGEAKRDYETARFLFDNGDYARARLRFESAYRASKEPRLLWNAAACEAKQFHYGVAINLVHRYLAEGYRVITSEDRERARAFLRAAERMTVALRIRCNVRDASVYLDGELWGETPLGDQFRVDPGRHEVVVKKAGFENTIRTIMVGSTDHDLQVTLREIGREGRILIRAHWRDDIFLDGKWVGRGTWMNLVPTGPHAVRVSRPGARPRETVVPVAETRIRIVELSAKRKAKAHSGGIPFWLWLAGGAVVTSAAATGVYFLARPSEEPELPAGSAGSVELPLGR
jgi:hypothetical protein